MLLLSAFLLYTAATHAQGKDASAGPTSCANEIPVGVKVIKLPDAEQHKVAISDFSVSASKDAPTYDLAMRVKNGTDNWCITSFGLTYLLGDARGQEWLANEYPAVLEFKTQLDSPTPAKGSKIAAAKPVPHSVGMAPGRDEKRVVFDLYDYFPVRPKEYFDGFHLISADIKYCMGYMLTKTP